MASGDPSDQATLRAREAAWLAGAVVGLWLVGMFGLWRTLPAPAFWGEFTNHAYRVLQLFGLEGDWTNEVQPLPFEINLLRLIAPMVTVAGVVLLFAKDAWQTLRNLRLLWYRQHVVIAGASDLAVHLARSAVSAGTPIVVIEPDPNNEHLARFRRLRIPILNDTHGERAWRRARLDRARDLLIVLPDDGMNVELCIRARDWLDRPHADHAATPLRIHLHLEEISLAARLQSYPKFFTGLQQTSINFFNVDELSARLLFRTHPPEIFADALGADQVHIALFGYNGLAEQIILHAVRQAHFASPQVTRLSVFCSDANSVKANLEARFPEFDSSVAIIDFHLMPHLDDYVLADLPSLAQGVTTYVICVPDEAGSLDLALQLRARTMAGHGQIAPIMVRMRRTDGLAHLLEPTPSVGELPDGLFPFGMLDMVMAIGDVADDGLDRLAQALHQNYVGAAGAPNGESPLASRARQPWSKLPEFFRRENRLQADHAEALVRAIGGRMVPAADGPAPPPLGLAEDELDRLGQMEKRRWIAHRKSDGWRYATTRNDLAKQHDQLKPWSTLTPEEQFLDRSAIASLPKICIDALGLEWRRDVVIGVTGHRSAADTPALRNAITQALSKIREAHPKRSFVVMSPLAEGPDRLVAELAMTQLNAALYVPLPMPFELYVEDFGTAQPRLESIAEFQRFIGRAERYYELPLRFGTLQDISSYGANAARARSEQYALCGAFILQRTHELIAIWNGEAFDQSSVGGTAHMIHCLTNGIPERYRYGDHFFPAASLQRAQLITPEGVLTSAPVSLVSA